MFYYAADRHNIPICIGCYCTFSATNLPQSSHTISDWYLRKVGLGIKALKSTFVINDAEMKTVTKTGNMTMPMLCRNCEDMHSPLEGALGQFSPVVDALFSLNVNGFMPDEDICRAPTCLNFMEESDNLPHNTLYGFVVTNLMRLLASELMDTQINPHIWELFDRLRAEIRRLSEVTKESSAESKSLFLYCIPNGGEIWMQVVRKFYEFALVLSDSACSDFKLYEGDGGSKYVATIQGPLVLVGSVQEVSAFATYRIVPDKDRNVVLPLTEGNSRVLYTLHSLYMSMFMASKGIILAACDDTMYDYSTTDAVDSIKKVKFCKELVFGWAQSLEKHNVHRQLLAWCDYFDRNATENLYSYVVRIILRAHTDTDCLNKRHDAALSRLSFADMKLFTKCFKTELSKIIPAELPKLKRLTEKKECIDVMKTICKEIGYFSHVYRLYNFSAIVIVL